MKKRIIIEDYIFINSPTILAININSNINIGNPWLGVMMNKWDRIVITFYRIILR